MYLIAFIKRGSRRRRVAPPNNRDNSQSKSCLPGLYRKEVWIKFKTDFDISAIPSQIKQAIEYSANRNFPWYIWLLWNNNNTSISNIRILFNTCTCMCEILMNLVNNLLISLMILCLKICLSKIFVFLLIFWNHWYKWY